jgi:Domain of unknown function (DUF4149)
MSTITNFNLHKSNWQLGLILALAFWFSGSIILDAIIMPSMYATGMMADPNFATLGYTIFGVFNRVELIFAGLILTGFLMIRNQEEPLHKSGLYPIMLSVVLMTIALIYTYILTPQMSALGLNLNLFSMAEVPTTMNQMHLEYWLLEVVKLLGVGTLLKWCYRY